MRQLAVLAQGLSMIGGQDEERPCGQLALIEVGKESSHERVDVSHFPPIPLSGRGLVGGVRIVEVKEGEEGAPGVSPRVEPIESALENGGSPPLGDESRDTLVPGIFDGVVVEIETPVESEARVQNEGSDEGGGVVPLALEVRRERRETVVEVEPDVVADSMKHRGQAGEERGVRGKRRWGDGRYVLIEDPLRRQPIHVRRSKEGGSVARKVVGAERIDAQEDEVPSCRPGLLDDPNRRDGRGSECEEPQGAREKLPGLARLPFLFPSRHHAILV